MKTKIFEIDVYSEGVLVNTGFVVIQEEGLFATNNLPRDETNSINLQYLNLSVKKIKDVVYMSNTVSENKLQFEETYYWTHDIIKNYL